MRKSTKRSKNIHEFYKREIILKIEDYCEIIFFPRIQMIFWKEREILWVKNNGSVQNNFVGIFCEIGLGFFEFVTMELSINCTVVEKFFFLWGISFHIGLFFKFICQTYLFLNLYSVGETHCIFAEINWCSVV